MRVLSSMTSPRQVYPCLVLDLPKGKQGRGNYMMLFEDIRKYILPLKFINSLGLTIKNTIYFSISCFLFFLICDKFFQSGVYLKGRIMDFFIQREKQYSHIILFKFQRLILIFLSLLTALMLTLTSSVSAQETGKYIAKKDLKTLSMVNIWIGAEVDFLGVISVPTDVAKSGKLATFKLNDGIYNADADFFYPAPVNANYSLNSILARDDGETASICATLVFSNSNITVDLSNLDLTQFIRVKSGGKPVTNFNIRHPINHKSYRQKNTEFCVAGLKHSNEFEISILKGLPGLKFYSVQALNNDIKFYTRTKDMSPSIDVSTAQNILPTSLDASIPVSTVNISELQIEIFKIDLRTITNFNQLFKNLDGSDINSLSSFYANSIAKETISIPNGKNEKKSFNLKLNKYLNKSGIGLYVVILSSENQQLSYYTRRATQWIMKSDIAVTSYAGQNTVDIFLSNFQSAKPIDNVKIQILANNNRVLFEGLAKNGHIKVAKPLLNGVSGHAPKYLIAQHGETDAVILPYNNIDFKPRQFQDGLSKPNARDTYITTERALYRVGDSIHVTGIIKNLNLKSVSDTELVVDLIKPNGSRAERSFVETNKAGLFLKTFDISNNAVLGRYEVRVSAVDEISLASHFIEVKDFVPLTIEAKLEVKDNSLKLNKTLEIQLGAEYFSGGPAANLDAEITISIQKVRRIPGKHLNGFTFGRSNDQETEVYQAYQNLILGEDGKVSKVIATDFNVTKDILLEAHIKGIVFDVGGRPNKTKQIINVETISSFVGVLSKFGTQIDDKDIPTFEVAHVDRSGTAVAFEGLKYRLVKVSYNYNWYYTDGWRWRKTRVSDEFVEGGPITSKNLSLNSQLDWGSYEIIVTNKAGFETVLSFFSGWGADQKPVNEPETLVINVDKLTDSLGRLRVDLPYSGRLQLITAQSDIISEKSFDVTKGQFEAEFEIPTDIEPGINVLATLIRPISTGTEHLPQIALGASWLENLNEGRILKTNVEVSDTGKSSDPIKVSINSSSKNGFAVLMLVDQGIHSITNFRNVNPQDHFFGQRQLNLGLTSNFGQLIKQEISLETIRVGGDELGSVTSAPKSNFFKTVALTSPILEIVDGKVDYTFQEPLMEGRLRLVAISINETGLGFTEKNITIQDPVSLDISLPRFIGTGDIVYGKLALRANSKTDDILLEKYIGLERNESSISLDEGKSFISSVRFETKVSGTVPVSIKTKIKEENVERNFSLVSRPTSYPFHEIKALKLNNKNWLGKSKTFVPPLKPSHFNLNDAEDLDISISITAMPGVNLTQVLAALNRYPYGCIEQTSSATRGLIARALYLGLDAETRQKINHGLVKIIAKQKTSGAFGYWDRNGSVYERFQPYAVETLILGLPFAEDKDLITNAISTGLDYLYESYSNDHEVQLYTYGILAKAGYEVTSRSRYLIDRIDNSHTTNLELLSLSYWLASLLDDENRMKRLDKKLNKGLLGEDREELGVNSYAKWTYPTSIKHALTSSKIKIPQNYGYLLNEIKVEHKTDNTRNLVESIQTYLAAKSYRSTAINAKLTTLQIGRDKSVVNEEVYIDGKVHKLNTNLGVPISVQQLKDGFEIKHSSLTPLVVNAEIVGKRKTIRSINNGLSVAKYWTKADGTPINSNHIETLSIKQGDVFNVTIVIKANMNFRHEDLLLTDLLPSGFEIEETNAVMPTEIYVSGSLQTLTPRDIDRQPETVQAMDDRYIAHFTGGWRSFDRAIINYNVRAAYAGEMVIPDAHVEFMYAPEINGRSYIKKAVVIGK